MVSITPVLVEAGVYGINLPGKRINHIFRTAYDVAKIVYVGFSGAAQLLQKLPALTV